jgi:hypothetical protein
MTIDGYQLAELSDLFGLSEEPIKRLSKSHGFPLRRLRPMRLRGHPVRIIALAESSTACGPAVRIKKPRIRKSRSGSLSGREIARKPEERKKGSQVGPTFSLHHNQGQ